MLHFFMLIVFGYFALMIIIGLVVGPFTKRIMERKPRAPSPVLKKIDEYASRFLETFGVWGILFVWLVIDAIVH